VDSAHEEIGEVSKATLGTVGAIAGEPVAFANDTITRLAC
jgi:hypothetical protein